MGDTDPLRRWAGRFVGGGEQAPPRAPAAAHAPAPPVPPPGHGLVWDATRGAWVAVPVYPQPQPYAQQNLPRAAGAQGIAPVIPIRRAPDSTCALVKPGNRDPYAEFLATIPDLPIPDYGTGYDAMSGRMSPTTAEALHGIMEAPSAEPLAPYTRPTVGADAMRDLGGGGGGKVA